MFTVSVPASALVEPAGDDPAAPDTPPPGGAKGRAWVAGARLSGHSAEAGLARLVRVATGPLEHVAIAR